MADQHHRFAGRQRASSGAANSHYTNGHTHGGFDHRRDSMQSTSSIASFYSDVEFAQDEVFAGPTSESLPSSAASFHHRRRPRTESTTSWAFYEPPPIEEQEASTPEDAVYFDDDLESARSVAYEDDQEEDDRISFQLTRKASVQSIEPLLGGYRHSFSGMNRHGLITSQKVYIESEDLTIVITGFKTSWWKSWIYIAICTLTLGLGWLLFRWFPRWRVALTADQVGLGECEWVIVENQWNEFARLEVKCRQYGQPLSSVFGLRNQRPSTMGYDEDDPIVHHLRYIDYRYIRFIYNPLFKKFLLNNHWKDPEWTSMRALRTGIDGDSKNHRNLVFSDNVIDIEEKSTWQLLVDEAFHPFYVFQIASLILWSLDEYYYYAICIFLISAFSIASTLHETKSAMRRLREVSRFVCDVRVLRNGFWRYVPSSDLVPGDVYEVSDPGLTLFPCDSLLLTGDCIVNESMLTGESVPVSKNPIERTTVGIMDLGQPAMHPAVTRHFLYCGTKIIRARRPQAKNDDEEPVALGLVVRTGFNTTKGSLVRSMLFPKPSGFKFYRDSFYYIGFMAGIAALGFIASLVNFIKIGLPAHLIIVRALDLITIVVPPALPATLAIGTSFALSRLRKRDIFCISPQRVNVGGKLDIVAFDKTGTLTEDGLDVLGVHTVHTATKKFSKLHEHPDQLVEAAPEDHALFKSLFHTMTTCHQLRLVDGELLGDPLDLKMFEWTNWVFEEGEGTGEGGPQTGGSGLSPSTVHAKGETEAELGILRSFEFDAALRRTSVIVKRYRATGGDIFVKGAPECMKDICKPDTFPENFDELLEEYTHSGYRVIGCATRHVPNLKWLKAQKMKRAEAESDLTFAGFIVFENKLKPETFGALKELRDADIRTLMCTGDNILTAISVAKTCELITSPVVFVPSFITGDSGDAHARVRWQSMSEPPIFLDDQTLLPVAPEMDGENPIALNNLQTYTLAVTGEVFRWVVDFAPPIYLQRMLVRAAIFARMSPDEKHELVEKLQSLEYTVGFCGDGANDCGALKAADVGISLSEAEASVAAPFTSRVFNISCVPQVIREGRAALVTSFSCFKYMSLYSAIQFTSVSILYRFGSNLGDFQFLFIDLFLILPIAVFMGWSQPYPVLSKKRPTASLVSRKVLVPLVGQIIWAAALQLMAYFLVKQQSWYIPPVRGDDKTLLSSSPNTTLFLFSCFEYVFASVVLSVGKPYRRAMFHNWPYMATVAFGLGVTLLMMWGCPKWLWNLMQLTKMEAGFKGVLMGMGVGYLVGAWWGETKVLPRVAKGVGRCLRWVKGWGKEKKERGKKRKQWKVLEEDMRM